MDLGATVCVSRAPRCDACPAAALCRGRGNTAPAVRARQSPFATSDRRVRGRIVALLRDRESMTANAVRRELADDRVLQLLFALVSEGLVQRHGRRVRLPV
jgi:A/G-specific adenine glycosylase